MFEKFNLVDNKKSFSEIEEILTLSSCATSTSNGLRRLTSGVEVYCEDGWTVSEKLTTVISGIAGCNADHQHRSVNNCKVLLKTAGCNW